MNNNQIEQIKQFLHNEICERRDYSASKMCEEVLKFIEQMENNKQEQKQLLIDMMNDDAKDGLYENTTLNQLIKLYEDQITEMTRFVFRINHAGKSCVFGKTCNSLFSI